MMLDEKDELISPSLAEIVAKVHYYLKSIDTSKYHLSALVGFDGFIDKIQKAIKSRHGEEIIYFKSINEYSEHLVNLSGRSGQFEIVTTQVKLGGNAPILSNALASLGVKSHCLGALGIPEINGVFQSLNPLVDKISVASPGHSQALEFTDGKVILSELSSFNDYNWNSIKQRFTVSNLQRIASECKLFALVDWANIPYALDIWSGFLEEVIKPHGKSDSLFLFDLCDPSKKSPGEIVAVLDLIGNFSKYGNVTLALNENEAIKIWFSLNSKMEDEPPPLSQIGSFIYAMTNIESLLIHPIDRTIVFQKHNITELYGHLVKEPIVLTGGGDNLNAGFGLGLLMGLDISQSMILGMATSGAFIKNGKSPDIQDLISYLDLWRIELVAKIQSR
jgi:hypothetical protein